MTEHSQLELANVLWIFTCIASHAPEFVFSFLVTLLLGSDTSWFHLGQDKREALRARLLDT